jgi:hypothetical protein
MRWLSRSSCPSLAAWRAPGCGQVVSGTALAAAVLEELAAGGSAGVFASHLHDLVWLLQPLVERAQLAYWAMEVRTRDRHTAAVRLDKWPTVQPGRRLNRVALLPVPRTGGPGS